MRIRTISMGEPSGRNASIWKGTWRMRSHSHMRSTGVLSGPSARAANSGEQVNGQWPVMPMFHSTPPLNQALRMAKLAG